MPYKRGQMNKLEVTIRWLANLIKQPEPKNMCCTLHFTYRETDKDGFRAAIRLLEAAGGIDRKLAITSLHESIFESDDPWREDDPTFQQIYALLAALPDEGKEREKP